MTVTRSSSEGHSAELPSAWTQARPPGTAEPRWIWRRKREDPEAGAPAAVPEELPEQEEPAAEPEPTEVAAETPLPAVTKRPLDLPGLEEPETPAPPPPEPQSPPPEPEAEPEPAQPPQAEPVAEEPAPSAPREWNLWDLERQALEHSGDAARDEEWLALFVYLRQFASTEGLLPKEFDGLVRESFAELIQAA